MRDAEDRLPELRILRILVLLRLFLRALFQRSAGFLNSFDQATLVAFFAARNLFFLFWIVIHQPFSVALHTDESVFIIEVAGLTFWPREERAGIDQDLSFCIE